MDKTLLIILCLTTTTSVWCKPVENAQLDKVTVNDVAANTVLATGDNQSSSTDKEDVASVQITGITTGAENGIVGDQQQSTSVPPFQPPRAGSMFARLIDDIFQEELLIPAAGYTASAVALFFTGIFGFSFNLFVMVLLRKDKQLWTPLNVILFNLVFSDFLVSILGNPLTFMSAVYHRWIFGRPVCVFYGFTMGLIGIVSITSLAVLAFERYLIISRPFCDMNLTFRRAKILTGCIWIYSLVLVTPPLLGWGEYVNEAAGISCSINWEERSYNSTTYILYLFVFGLVIPLVVITFSYVNIIIKIKKNSYRMGQVNKVEGKVAYMIFVMVLAFLIAWSPYAILALIVHFGDASLITPGVAVFPALLAKSSICYNPIIYVGLNAQFRQSLKRVKKSDKGFSTCETYALGTQRISREAVRLTLGNCEKKSDTFPQFKQTDVGSNKRLTSDTVAV